MTKQRTFKRRVRTRMAKTGESYSAARRMLIDTPAQPQESAAAERATGRSTAEWFALLDDSGAAERSHAEIARWLAAQEQARGRRLPHERPDGFRITASKTIAVPVSELFAAFTDEARRARWLPDAPLAVRTATASRSARYDWDDGTSRVNVGFTARSDTSSTIALSHERLPDADAAEEMKRWWRARLTELKAVLEPPPRK
jgi:uncharacterized protein YndB with AHSA1/START domain